MKPLSEFAEELRKQKSHTYASENGDYYRGFDVGVAHAVALLQAWLREVQKELDLAFAEADPYALDPLSFIRDSLLGTTRTEGKK